MAGLVGPAGWILGLVFLAMSIRDPFWLLLAVPFMLVALVPLLRPLRLCDDALVIPRCVTRPFRLPLSEIAAIEIGPVHWSGWSGYRGLAMTIETVEGTRILVQHSLYCGRTRLGEWAHMIRTDAKFDGTVRQSMTPQRWEGPHHFPVV